MQITVCSSELCMSIWIRLCWTVRPQRECVREAVHTYICTYVCSNEHAVLDHMAVRTTERVWEGGSNQRIWFSLPWTFKCKVYLVHLIGVGENLTKKGNTPNERKYCFAVANFLQACHILSFVVLLPKTHQHVQASACRVTASIYKQAFPKNLSQIKMAM